MNKKKTSDGPFSGAGGETRRGSLAGGDGGQRLVGTRRGGGRGHEVRSGTGPGG